MMKLLLDALQKFVISAKEVASSSGNDAVIDHDGNVVVEVGGGGGDNDDDVGDGDDGDGVW